MNLQKFFAKHGLVAGQKIEIIYNEKKYSGFVVPSPSNNLVLKLSNGYNAGFDISKISSVRVLEQKKRFSQPAPIKIKQNKALPKISLIHTGGTIASRVDYRTGAVVSAFSEKDLFSMFPELQKTAFVLPRFLSQMWSDDLRFSSIKKLAFAVKEEYEKGVQGIIIGMGTDNLAVASAALTFAVPDCPIPVLFVGSQRSSDRPSTDAALNLLSAAYFISKTDFAGIAVCMHAGHSDTEALILPALKTKKLHTSARNAFKPVNSKPIARINFYEKKIVFLTENYRKKNLEKKELEIKPDFEEKIGFVKANINFDPKLIDFYIKEGYKGLVLEGTGLGHFPAGAPTSDLKKNLEIFRTLKKFSEKGGLIVMTSNCLFGSVNLNVYDRGRDLKKIGVVSGKDMLPETAFVKLAWLLKNEPLKAKKLVSKNLFGEITDRRFPE